LVLLVSGFWFLVNGVNHTHQLEEVSRELHKIEQMQTLFLTDRSEFCVRSAMILMNCDCAKAKAVINFTLG